MKIIHMVTIDSTPEIQRELASMGIFIGDSNIVTFKVDETHESWPAIEAWIVNRDASDLISTSFLKEEIEKARWLLIVGKLYYGYPQPKEGEFGYLNATYDLTNYCKECGIGLIQKAPFQMKGEPKWGQNGILQLNWVYDQYFVKPEVWTSIFKPHGVNCRPVLNTRGAELKTVVQLVIEEEIGVVTEGLPGENCPKCGRMKYHPVTRGPFPPLISEPSGNMVKTKEYFGSGASAPKKILASQSIASALDVGQVKGVTLWPVKEFGKSSPQ
jgi:hypothetical protein